MIIFVVLLFGVVFIASLIAIVGVLIFAVMVAIVVVDIIVRMRRDWLGFLAIFRALPK